MARALVVARTTIVMREAVGSRVGPTLRLVDVEPTAAEHAGDACEHAEFVFHENRGESMSHD